jgi:hypothetical protein
MRRMAVVPLVMLCSTSLLADQSDIERLTSSEPVVKEVMAADDKAIPGSLFQLRLCILQKSRCWMERTRSSASGRRRIRLADWRRGDACQSKIREAQ